MQKTLAAMGSTLGTRIFKPEKIFQAKIPGILDSWPSRVEKKNPVGIFEYILASMLKVYLDVF